MLTCDWAFELRQLALEPFELVTQRLVPAESTLPLKGCCPVGNKSLFVFCF